MRAARWALYLWPGLPELWWQGTWFGLALATAFGLLVQLVLAATWVWDELLGPGSVRAVWAGFAALWLLLVLLSRFANNGQGAESAGSADLFPAALVEYLRGHWLEAGRMCRKLLAQRPGDVEAGILLAAVLRHTGHVDDARETLDALCRWDRAAYWKMEIDVEYQRLAEKERRLAEEMERKVHDANAGPKSLPNVREAA